MLKKLFNRTPPQTIEDEMLGSLAVELGYCTEKDIEEALLAQRERLHLGQILVDLGKLTEEQRSDLLVEQKMRRGEKIPAVMLRQHERRKLRKNAAAISGHYQRIGTEAQGLASHILEKCEDYAKA
jgi:hypothetical protein